MNIRHLIPSVLLTLLIQPTYADQTDFPRLAEQRDRHLQQLLNDKIHQLNLHKAVKEKRLAVTLVDITDTQNPKIAEVNGTVMLYAASLPKIAILLGAFQKAEEGKLVIDAPVKHKLVNMIRHSSNHDATELLDMVGEQYLADLLQSDSYQFYKPEQGGIWVGKAYGKKPAWKRDPLFNISHGASSTEVARFYYMLATNRLVSAESCVVMKEILSKPAIKHKFVKGLLQAHPDAKMYRKSGTWRSYHSDSALVERNGRRYILVVLANDPRGSKWLENIAVEMDNIIFADEKSG